MPLFESTQVLARPLEEVFRFFRNPANLVLVTPPELNLRLVEGPQELELGSRLVFQVRRMGITQRIVSEVTVFENNALFTDTQVQGPFGKWVHTHRFEKVPEGTRVSDTIEFAPPGGMLGFFLTARMIEEDLRRGFSFRSQRLAELLGPDEGQSIKPPG